MEATPTLAQQTVETDRPRAKNPRRRSGADVYDTLLWRLLPRLEDRLSGGHMIGVTSCDRRAGVSTVATNLAIRAADNHLQPTLLVDANPNAPRIGKYFKLRKAAGLAELLSGDKPIDQAVHETEVEGLSVMPLGSADLMERSGVDHRHVELLLESLAESYRFVVFDFPTVPELRHTLLFARRLDGVLMAVGSEATTSRKLEQSTTALLDDGVSVIGSVLTRHRRYTPRWLRRWL